MNLKYLLILAFSIGWGTVALPGVRDDAAAFKTNNVTRFTTKGHKKAGTLELSFKYPSNWATSEGERPHIVQKFKGTGNGVIFPQIIVQINDFPAIFSKLTETFTGEGLFTKENLREFWSAQNAKFIDGEETRYDGELGAWVLLNVEVERSGIEVFMVELVHIVPYNNQMAMVICAVGGAKENSSEIMKAFSDYRPLFTQVGASINIENKWREGIMRRVGKKALGNKIHLISYLMAIGISATLYIAIALIIAVTVSLVRKRPIKEFAVRACGIGLFLGTLQGFALMKKEVADYNKRTPPPLQSQADWLSEMGGKDLENRMQGIIEKVQEDPKNVDHKTRVEFYRMLVKYTDGNKDKIQALKHNNATLMKKYKAALFQDAQDAYRLGQSIKSARRVEYEQILLEQYPEFQDRISIDDGFIAIVAGRKEIRVSGGTIKYEPADIARLSDKSSEAWSMVESLFDEPE